MPIFSTHYAGPEASVSVPANFYLTIGCSRPSCTHLRFVVDHLAELCRFSQGNVSYPPAAAKHECRPPKTCCWVRRGRRAVFHFTKYPMSAGLVPEKKRKALFAHLLHPITGLIRRGQGVTPSQQPSTSVDRRKPTAGSVEAAELYFISLSNPCQRALFPKKKEKLYLPIFSTQ